MIGRTVQFTVTRDNMMTGLVLDKINMLNKRPPEDEDVVLRNSKVSDYSVVTGYLIQDQKGKLHNIQYWRIISISSKEDSIFDDNRTPTRHLPGGYNAERS